MAKIGRPGLPSQKRHQVWDMWKAGRSISEISRMVGSPPGSIFSILLPYGACAVQMLVICGDRPRRSSARLAILACPNEDPCFWWP
jgi:hypothetical protein